MTDSGRDDDPTDLTDTVVDVLCQMMKDSFAPILREAIQRHDARLLAPFQTALMQALSPGGGRPVAQKPLVRPVPSTGVVRRPVRSIILERLSMSDGPVPQTEIQAVVVAEAYTASAARKRLAAMVDEGLIEEAGPDGYVLTRGAPVTTDAG